MGHVPLKNQWLQLILFFCIQMKAADIVRENAVEQWLTDCDPHADKSNKRMN